MFGSTHYNLQPDIITIAKGLTSAYAPLSGSIVSEKVWKVLEQGTDELGPIGHGWTYSAHPIGAAAGIANLKLIDELGLVENAGKLGKHLTDLMAEALGDHPNVGEVRGEGMLCALDFVADRNDRVFFPTEDKVGPRIAGALLKRGVIARAMPQGDILGFAPPLCLTRDEADTIVTQTTAAIRTSSNPDPSDWAQLGKKLTPDCVCTGPERRTAPKHRRSPSKIPGGDGSETGPLGVSTVVMESCGCAMSSRVPLSRP